MGLKLNMTVDRVALIAAIAALSTAASIAVETSAASTQSAPVAHTACRHYPSHSTKPPDPTAPCEVGNVFGECNYAFCESSKYLRCTLSAELGKVVTHLDKDGLGSSTIEHPHKTATCQGSATILSAYLTKGMHAPYTWQAVKKHGRHRLAVTLHGYSYHGSINLFSEDLVVMAQHGSAKAAHVTTATRVPRAAASVPMTHTTCHAYLDNGSSGHLSSDPSSPCIVGNVIVQCGYDYPCENSKYLKCKLSAELGKVVHFPLPEGLEGTRIEHPHKDVTCKGSATILKAYVLKGEHEPYVYQLVRHGRHSLTITLYIRPHGLTDKLLEVMAQR